MLSKYLSVFFISMVPIIELRGAIPVGVGLGLPLWQVYIIAIIGNMIPVPFIFFFARKVLEWGADKPVIGKFFTFCLEKGHKGGEKLKAKAGRGLGCLDRHPGCLPPSHGLQVQRPRLHGRRAAGRLHHGRAECAGRFRIRRCRSLRCPGIIGPVWM